MGLLGTTAVAERLALQNPGKDFEPQQSLPDTRETATEDEMSRDSADKSVEKAKNTRENMNRPPSPAPTPVTVEVPPPPGASDAGSAPTPPAGVVAPRKSKGKAGRSGKSSRQGP